MIRPNWPLYSAIAGFNFVALVCLVELMIPRFAPAAARPLNLTPAMESVGRSLGAAAPATRFATAEMQALANLQARTAPASPVPAEVAAPAAEEGYYAPLRSSMRWVGTRLGKSQLATPDYDSRLRLAKSAADRAGLAEVGLSFHDVYGITNAETSWVPRTGASKDGTPNLGIAQFEPATARALGLRNPDDVVEAVHVAAKHMKEAAFWSAERISGLKLGADDRASKLREGVSIYYNLSSRGRAAWNGRNTNRLPTETLRHIANARIGAVEAAQLDAQLRTQQYGRGRGIVTASLAVNGG
ncbi:MAG: hypothetical protein ABIU58_05215 [Ramlibacter sp.]